jgi:flagellar assembly protein FliH
MSSERPASPQVDSHDEPFLYIPTNGDPGETTTPGGRPIAWNVQGAAAKAAAEQREKDAHDRGVKEGEARAAAAAQFEIAAAKSAISTAIEKFRTEREAYFKRVEPEVVQLALAIARKILHREAQMDPLLLEGMVHVALEKIGAGTRVRLWAHPVDIQLWNEHFSKLGLPQILPELVGDPALKRGECAIETEIGSTQVSLETQLKEIEQGFFDLLEQRPQVR